MHIFYVKMATSEGAGEGVEWGESAYPFLGQGLCIIYLMNITLHCIQTAQITFIPSPLEKIVDVVVNNTKARVMRWIWP